MERLPITQLSHVRLAVKDLSSAAHYATHILGLEKVAEKPAEAAFRADDRYQTLTLVLAPESSAVAIEVTNAKTLETLAERLTEHGFAYRKATVEECMQRSVREALFTRDASGNIIELVVRPAHSGKRYFPSRDAGITGLHSLGLRSIDIAGDLRLWCQVLNASVSDQVGEISYLRFDQEHHRIALYPSSRPGILYVNFSVERYDHIMEAHYFLQEQQVKSLHGPGREAASGQIFLRFEGPDGHVFSYGHAMQKPDAHWRARQFPLEPTSLCHWGSHCNALPELSGSETEEAPSTGAKVMTFPPTPRR